MSDFKIGDIVSCGRMGWWRVKATDPNKFGRIILEMVMDGKGIIPKRPRVFSANTMWCKKISVEQIKKQKEEDRQRWDTLLFIMDPSLVSEDLVNKDVKGIEKPEPDYLLKLNPPPSLYKK